MQQQMNHVAKRLIPQSCCECVRNATHTDHTHASTHAQRLRPCVAAKAALLLPCGAARAMLLPCSAAKGEGATPAQHWQNSGRKIRSTPPRRAQGTGTSIELPTRVSKWGSSRPSILRRLDRHPNISKRSMLTYGRISFLSNTLVLVCTVRMESKDHGQRSKDCEQSAFQSLSGWRTLE